MANHSTIVHFMTEHCQAEQIRAADVYWVKPNKLNRLAGEKEIKTQKSLALKLEEKYIVHALLIFSWPDTFWEHRIWRVDTFWFCLEYAEISKVRRSS